MKAIDWRRWLDGGLVQPPESAPNTRTRQFEKKGHLATISRRVTTGFSDVSHWQDAASGTISDEIVHKQRSGLCRHEKRSIQCPATVGDVDFISPRGYRHWSVGSLWGWIPPQDVIDDGNMPSIPLPSYPSFPDLDYSDAINDMRPKIEEGISGLVTLAEIRDVFSVLTGPIRIARNLVRGRGSLPKRLLNAVGSTFLQHKFANEQVLRDGINLYTALSTVDENLSRLMRGVGEVKVSRYRFPVTEVSSSDHSTRSDYDWSYIIDKQVDYHEAVNVTMRYTYHLVDSAGQLLTDPRLLQLGAYLDALGVRVNPAIIWDLIPFSFVIDYFVGVGEFLESFALRNINARIAISDFCVTRKISWTRSLHFQTFKNPSRDGGTRLVGDLPITETYSLFERRRLFPKPEWLHPTHSLPLNDPSWSQWAVMFSLVSANLR